MEVGNIVSRKEVAELSGVSEATVSRVLNAVGPIKEDTRRRVLDAANQLGYVPSALARNFARSKSGHLGVVMPYVPKAHLFSAYFFSEMLSGIGNKARDSGLDLLLLFRKPGERIDYSSLFRQQRIDTCIILGARDDHDEEEALKRLQEEGRPFCVMNHHFEGQSFCEVDADHVEGSRAAVSHLIEQGYKRIAFLNGPDIYSNSTERLKGYRTALQEAGIEYDHDLLLEGNYSRRSGLEASATIADKLNDIDAVFAANDRMALGVMQGLRERGLAADRFPAFVGYDDSDAAEMAVPPLSSVRVPFYEMGELAASKLIPDSLNLIPALELTGRDSIRELLSTELIIRASSIRP
ncbi:LacI family DNA-binding transcriptional regulator [Paenibacillus sp. SEL1]|uniref:LacI family DNA-binding transcriptional regulator n=1 Tax=Paenibacillus polymyxa TaxID=1406 RepID=UPI002AB36E66|nr:LacI family DNA-binding transcriptional regulator [Paenibacillus polymyxa]MDY7991079.1 LacI family DNA-binding transcriptional regulator [Paenibacillus polymyxa]MDY8119870.1 LacI family DNA-binding transcriptional regulator [Paenibacillus polymyxa]